MTTVAPWDSGAYANDTYLQSLKTSSADVTRQVQNTLAEIARQRQVAGTQTTKIPGAANTAFSGAEGTLASLLASIGQNPLAAVTAAFSGGRAAYGRAAGLLDQGFGEQQVQRNAQTENIKQQLLADLIRQGNEYAAQRAAEDRDRAFQTEENARSRALQEKLAAMQSGGGGGYLAPPSYPQPVSPYAPPPGQREFDENYYRAVAAYGPQGGVHFLMNNHRPGGLTAGQRATLTALQRRQTMLGQRLQ